MENDKLQAVSELEPLTKSLAEFAREELNNAFVMELQAYESFIDIYQNALKDYHSACLKFKEEKHVSAFLYKNIQLNNQIQEALGQFSKLDEVLLLPQTYKKIAHEALEHFSNLGKTDESFFYGIIEKTSRFQEQNKHKLEKKFDELVTKVYTEPEIEESEQINSLIYLYFDQSILDLLKNKEEALQEIYKQFAELTNHLRAEFELNTVFSQKLDKVKFTYENLNPIDFEWDLILEANSKTEIIKKNFQLFLDELIPALESSILDFNFGSLSKQKAKTLEKTHLLKYQNEYFNKFIKTTSNWRYTRLAISDDWCLDLEINVLKHRIIKEYLDFVNFFNNNFNEPLFKDLAVFKQQLEKLASDLNKKSTILNDENIFDVLRDFKIQIKKDLLIKTLPAIRNHINNSNLINEIVAFEKTAENSFSSVSQERKLMKTPDYLRAISSSELETISPNDLVSFEIKPKFIQVFPAFQRAIIDHIQKLILAIETAPNISIYSIESATQFFEENKQIEQTVTICNEGLKRSISKVNETILLHENFVKNEIEKLSISINEMASSIIEITDNESAMYIKMRVLKAKAIARTKDARDKMLTKIRKFLPVVIEKSKTYFQFLQDSSQKFAKQFIYEKSSNFISTDVSDFLSATQSSLSKLPYVYQRLFSFEPLKTFELYVERKVQMEMLNLAFSKWNEEKFSPVVLIGERGSGKTTFIRKFFKNKTTNEDIIYLDLHAENKSPEEIYHQIAALVNEVKPNQGVKRILSLDGLERIFQAKIDGFEYLLRLFKLISQTHKDIFWIVSVHTISWQYFDKTIHASNYFGYHIQLNELGVNELINLIESRHNLSGYKIYFHDSLKKRGVLSSNSTLSETDRQENFKKTFYSAMNKNVQGNILQTYLYWMRSAELKENDTISISMDNKLDFDFVRSIPAQKLLILRSILIHNGLSLEKLAEIFRTNLFSTEMQLIQMTDDGILKPSNGIYNVNPLIYKQLIKHLNNINLLH
jgi:hypothetical protein